MSQRTSKRTGTRSCSNHRVKEGTRPSVWQPPRSRQLRLLSNFTNVMSKFRGRGKKRPNYLQSLTLPLHSEQVRSHGEFWSHSTRAWSTSKKTRGIRESGKTLRSAWHFRSFLQEWRLTKRKLPNKSNLAKDLTPNPSVSSQQLQSLYQISNVYIKSLPPH